MLPRLAATGLGSPFFVSQSPLILGLEGTGDGATDPAKYSLPLILLAWVGALGPHRNSHLARLQVLFLHPLFGDELPGNPKDEVHLIVMHPQHIQELPHHLLRDTVTSH